MPRVYLPVGIFLLAALCAGGLALAEPEPDALEAPVVGALMGEVRSATEPLASAWVYAYEIAHFSLRKVTTSEKGDFRFTDLPAGLYKVIAFKSGFAPAVVMLSRTTGDATQRLELELTPDEGQEDSESGFWAARARIPTDVLRDIQVQTFADRQASSGGLVLPEARLRANMEAMTGVSDGLEYGAAQVSGGKLGIDGRIRDLEVELAGHYSELESEPSGRGSGAVSGQSQWFALEVDHRDSATIGFSSFNNRLLSGQGGGHMPVDFESHSVSWTQRIGEQSHSDFSAQYVSESNFHRQAAIDPAEIPSASRALRLEGSYTTPISEHATLEAGFRYQERQSQYATGLGPAFDPASQESVEVFGRGGVRVKPTVVVEYGLYSKLRDGTVSLVPQGGVIVQLSPNWRASTLASHRIEGDEGPELLAPEFHPVFHEETGPCTAADSYCYQVLLSRLWGDQQELSLGAVHRQVGDTLRVYFDRDFFSRLESLYMVRGDELPELQVGLTRRIAPKVLARLESNVAAGGGGIVHMADKTGYENRLRYLVTSLDTRFEQTDTGVFLAFHRLHQELDPIGGGHASIHAEDAEVDLERLQLSLTQDLGILRNLAADWAVHLNMELSRGSTPETADHDEDELRKRLTGGIAVRF